MSIIFENRYARLTVSEKGNADSLLLLSSGEELLDTFEPCSLFSVVQPRPFNNEVKLAHPNKETAFAANKITRDDDDETLLHVAFETVPVKARVRVTVAERYFSFMLEGFTVSEEDYPDLFITPPPVSAFRILALPVKKREHFGEWLNAFSDSEVTVCVFGASPYLLVDSDNRRDSRILFADAVAESGLTTHSAILIASPTEIFLDCMDAAEQAFNLPLGAQSRKHPITQMGCYRTAEATPNSIDRHISYCKAMGLRRILFYYTSFFREEPPFTHCGDFDYRKEYPNGADDVALMLKRVKDAGLIPGLHFLHTHIGLKSRYVTPHADARLHIKQFFTLKASLSATHTECERLYVQQNPIGSPTADGTRILKFGSELISYESYQTEYPFCFIGCRRGCYQTELTAHKAGEIGGILDVSEYGAGSCYLDLKSDLADEIAEKISTLYRAGFDFIYYDGSEGSIPPYGIYVAESQYRVWQRLKPTPLLAEGAAKSHFSWHFLNGGNAFDSFEPEVFKEKLIEYQIKEARATVADKTGFSFGWFKFWDKRTQPDQYEYGTSRAVAWGCPIGIISNEQAFDSHPRSADIFEVLRRWEDIRHCGLLTEEQKEQLKDVATEHHLLIDSEGKYTLVPYREIRCDLPQLRAFLFRFSGKLHAVYWNADCNEQLSLNLNGNDVTLFGNRLSDRQTFIKLKNSIIIPFNSVHYLRCDTEEERFTEALIHATVAQP